MILSLMLLEHISLAKIALLSMWLGTLTSTESTESNISLHANIAQKCCIASFQRDAYGLNAPRIQSLQHVPTSFKRDYPKFNLGIARID